MRYDKNGLPIKEYYTEEIKKSPQEKMKALKSIKGIMKYTNDIKFSSSNILNKYGDILNENQISLIKKLNIKYDYKKIKNL